MSGTFNGDEYIRAVHEQLRDMWEDGTLPGDDATDAELKELLQELESESTVAEVRYIIRLLNRNGPYVPPAPATPRRRTRPSIFDNPQSPIITRTPTFGRTSGGFIGPAPPTPSRRKRRASASVGLSIREQNDALRAEGRRIEAMVEELQVEVDRLQRRNVFVGAELEEHIQAFLKTEAKLKAAVEERDTLRTQHQNSTSAFSTATTSMQRDLALANERVQTAEQAQATAGEKMRQAQEEAKRAKDRQTELEKEMGELRTQLDNNDKNFQSEIEANRRANAENKRLRTSFIREAVSKKHELQKKDNEFKEKLAAKDRDIRDRDEELHARWDDIQNAQNELAAAQNQITALQRRLDRRARRRRQGGGGGGSIRSAERLKTVNAAVKFLGGTVPLIRDAQGKVVGEGEGTLPPRPRLRSAVNNNNDSDDEEDEEDQ
ncbi:hypothetical protein BJ508DRAFT_334234 [Ascobolus immersus RN42]|uniref:Uncharacterized protein n=1 Tax=Ascobolus immersus RN42 TaxID=1160509 RepID=A0A3N4HGV1_ASCIM|nr:hypothetical protein BJ508DRAFT_334234 [Ascobolus immersus RN42]